LRSTSERLRELAAALGFWPATTDGADIERHRQHNKNADYWLARGRRFDHRRREHDSVRIQRTESFTSRLGTDTVDLRLPKWTELPSACEFLVCSSMVHVLAGREVRPARDDDDGRPAS
jgi:hypothetical protein